MRNGMLLRMGAVLAVCQLCSCNLAPTYVRPDAPVPDRYPPSAAEGTLAPGIPWQGFFHDPVLRDLIGQALLYNRDLAGAAARIEQARAQFRIQRSQRLPGLDASASGQRLRTPLSAADGAPRVTVDSYAVQVGIPSFELDFWGRVANLSEVARRQYLATEEARNTAELSLVANVAASYYAVRASDEGIVLAERSLASRNETLELAQLRMDAGLTSSIDFNQSYALVTQTELQLAQLRRTQGQALQLRQFLVGAAGAAARVAAGSQRAADPARSRAALGAAGSAPGRAPGRAPAARGQRQHRRGAGAVLPDHRLDRCRRLRLQ